MGDFLILIENICKDKEKFIELVMKMNPLISKYTKILYKDEEEDIRSELVLALWAAVVKLKYVESEGQCITYFVNALKNKFYELYRNSRKIHDNQFVSEMEMLEQDTCGAMEYDDLIVKNDMDQYLRKHSGLRYQVYQAILFENLSDNEIAVKNNVTRQYVHRLRKQLYSELREKYFKI